MFRINSQPAPQPAKAVTGSTTAQPAPAPNSLEALMKSLEAAIQRLMQQQGGAQPGGGDRMEPSPQPTTHRHHPRRHFDQEPGSKGPPVSGASPYIPGGGHACGLSAEVGDPVRRGLAGGTVGT